MLTGRQFRKFHSPHPGFGGAAAPIPKSVKAVVDSLDGVSIRVGEAERMICQSAGPGYRTKVSEGMILLFTEDGKYPQYCWRAICFGDE